EGNPRWGAGRRRVAGHNSHRNLGPPARENGNELETAELRHVEVGQDAIDRPAFLDDPEAVEPVHRFQHAAASREHAHDDASHRRIIVDDEQRGAARVAAMTYRLRCGRHRGHGNWGTGFYRESTPRSPSRQIPRAPTESALPEQPSQHPPEVVDGGPVA